MPYRASYKMQKIKIVSSIFAVIVLSNVIHICLQMYYLG